jgi:signal transduction histidine kinase/CheY-like chemotaxis protein
MSSSRLSRWLSFAALVIVYVLAAKLGLRFAVVHASATPLWPPTGIALAALVIGGYRWWPAIFLGAFLANVTTAGSVATSLGIAAGNAAEALVGAWLVGRFANGRQAFALPRTIFAFVFGAGFVAPAISATAGVSSLALGGYAAWSAFGTIWLTWWLGDVAGALVVAPLLIVWANEPRMGDFRPRLGEAVALLAISIAAGALVFGGAIRMDAHDAPLAFLCLPPLVWGAYRFGPRGATTVLAVLSTIAAAGTLQAHGPFAVGGPNASLLMLQAFLITIAVTILPLAALAAELARREARSAENARAREGAESARADAEAASRAKDEFLAVLSHELRTPLTAIVGWARMLRAGNLPAGAMANAIEVIDRNAAAQVQLIEELLDVSRIVSGTLRLELRPVKLAPVLGAAIDAVRPTAERKGVHITSSVAASLDLVTADAGRLQQVFWNLLANAVKFTPSGGSVAVTATADADGGARVSVADTGSGIDAATLPHVFERFRQADSSMTRHHGGLGLGLTLVKHIVELHGGTVRAESDGPGQGATFTITLRPAGAAEATGPSTRPDDSQPAGAELAGVTVLVVDDEPDAREFCGAALARHGATVVTVDSVPHALERMDALKPAVVVADLAMPGEDGFALIRTLRAGESAGGRRVVAIALTAYAGEEDRRRVLDAGFDAHVAKPFDPADLAHTIHALLPRA